MSKRGNRRHHNERLKERAKKILKQKFWSQPRDIDQVAAKSFNHLKNCSCYMCGNPRKYSNEQTLQEMRNNEVFSQEIAEICR